MPRPQMNAAISVSENARPAGAAESVSAAAVLPVSAAVLCSAPAEGTSDVVERVCVPSEA